MKIEKLPSGSYRIRKMYKGKTYTIVTEYKPTQKEAMQLMSAELDNVKPSSARITFEDASNQYIDVKKNVLSPSSIRGYKGIINNLSPTFKALNINDIMAIDIQKEINEYSASRSPKTVRNAHGFISAVMGMFRPELNISTTLPQKLKNDEYIPSDDDVKRILEYAKGSKYEIPLILATFGLRRSEICALTPDDINGNSLSINKALVQTADKKWIIKSTKTTAGTREIYLPDSIIDLIKERGEIYSGYPNNIIKYLQRAQAHLNIPRFSLHKLRHYYASMSHSLGIPDSYIMASGGWQSDNTLKSVYRHAMDGKKEEMQKFAADYINEQILS